MSTPTEPGGGRNAVPDRVRTPLLQLITQESLDLDYQHVAERRGRQKQAPEVSDRSRAVVTGLVVAVFGVLLAVAAVQTSRSAPAQQTSKDDLIARVTASRKSVAALQDRIQTLKRDITTTQHEYNGLGSTLSSADTTLNNQLQHTGFAAASGGGIVVTVDDNPNGVPDDEVQDSDLSNLANGLWAAGATAIAVNGHRLTALSALRNSGSVIRVDGVSLSPPYQVVALGDPKNLAARFAQTSSGARFYDVTNALGMPTSVQNGTNLSVPAAPASMMQLRYAKSAGRSVGTNGTQEGM